MAWQNLWNRIARCFAGGRTVADLAAWLKLDRSELRDVPLDYRRFGIPKRGGGTREICAPNGRLKSLQRRIHRRLLRRLHSHPAATGFEPGRSIVDNARPHAGRAVVVCIDIIAFFPSIPAERVYRLFRGCGWGRGASRLLTRLCTHEGALPQGAPTSPKLSNLVNYFLDQSLQELAEGFNARYTRYADDITFSFAEDDSFLVKSLLWNARDILWWKGYTVHRRRKLSVRRRHQRQEVTGLVVNERPRLPREVRRRLRAVRHRVQRGDIATMSAQQIAGWESFERMVEKSRESRVESRESRVGMNADDHPPLTTIRPTSTCRRLRPSSAAPSAARLPAASAGSRARSPRGTSRRRVPRCAARSRALPCQTAARRSAGGP